MMIEMMIGLFGLGVLLCLLIAVNVTHTIRHWND